MTLTKGKLINKVNLDNVKDKATFSFTVEYCAPFIETLTNETESEITKLLHDDVKKETNDKLVINKIYSLTKYDYPEIELISNAPMTIDELKSVVENLGFDWEDALEVIEVV